MGRHGRFLRRQLSRRYRVGHPQSLGLAGGIRRAMQLSAMGHLDEAYRAAQTSARRAFRLGQHHQALKIESVISQMAPLVSIDTEDLIEREERLVRRAVAVEAWREALDHGQQLLPLLGSDPDRRRRVLTNRASILVTMGRFREALAAYDQLMSDTEAWYHASAPLRAVLPIYRAAAAWYLGELPRWTELGRVGRYIDRAPDIWQVYWWTAGHAALRARPQRVASLRASSLRSFDVNWSVDMDRMLWGLDLLAGGPEGVADQESRVIRALKDEKRTTDAIGRSGWLDLYTDWLEFLERNHPGRFRIEAAAHQVWCAERGYDGWAVYWQGRIQGTVGWPGTHEPQKSRA